MYQLSSTLQLAGVINANFSNNLFTFLFLHFLQQGKFCQPYLQKNPKDRANYLVRLHLSLTEA